ncbi:uncharacterized protein PRCAT00001281001 [Priceomyces carsonii]|uniref:uncharacterized protein n=1 Tax=Priceomyces carsonii TaxID=28549 RepID=UPI002EDB52AF|nr:unnamed protein product [Priceomyces carsonii]
MSSTIFYKFLSQKDQSTVHFDGTGISVFDLKHEIIVQNQLGQGNDFMLRLYHLEQPDLEYENDQDVIPRSSFVLARRSPSSHKNGKFNNASRYVSGKPRINRKAISTTTTNSVGTVTEPKTADENMTEEDRIKMMFENQSNAWAQTQDELSTHKAIYNKPNSGSNPEDLPPPGYICYRCGAKDHWIRNCPTNTDPNFEGKKIKRTTGIPRSYLKTISKEAVENQTDGADNGITTNDNGELVDQQGNTYMITDTGEYVIAMADSKTWNTYQEKQQNAAMKAKQEFEQQILNCIEKDGRNEFLDPLSTTKKLLVPPIVMTPCCQDKSKLKKLKNYNYSQPRIEQLLIENDFHCPNCGTEDVFIDSLIRNEDLENELETYIKEKQEEIGIENPATSLKHQLDSGDGPDLKRQRIDLPSKPNMFVPPPMPFGMPVPPVPMGMFMPPPPPPFNVNNESVNSNAGQSK